VSERPLRLLGVADLRSLNVIRWGRRLSELGHEVHIVGNRWNPTPAEREGLELYDVTTLEPLTRVPGLRRARFGPAIAGLAERLDVDLVHAHYMLPYGYWGAQAGRHPFVLSPWSRDVFIDAHERRQGRKRAHAAIQAADYFVVNSQACGEAAVELGADRERMQEIIWYAETDRFGVQNRDPGFRAARDWPDDAQIVLSLRNFRPYTYVDVLVEAFAQIANDHPKARLLLCARGGPERPRIESLIEQHGLGDRVRIERAEVKDLPVYVASADMAVTIADSDSTPASLTEAMASRLPVVAAPTWSIDEWLEDGNGAEIVPVKDVGATATAIAKLLDDPELRTRYGERNERVAREKLPKPGPLLETLYRELIAEHGSRRAAA
jgi:glycosyltransferase involved in cell wall biosynthesis